MSFAAAPGFSLSKFVESRINGGMITSIDPADIDSKALQLARNARIRFDKTSRRNGHTLLTPTKPNALRVLRIATLVDNQDNSATYRFTKTGVHRRTGASWVPVVGTLTGGDYDRIKTVVINNKFVFANNGANKLQLINTGADTFADLGNAPRYKYITGFYNRIVGANRLGGGSYNVEIGWSGDTNITEWDNSVDNTAGSSPLIESPDDFGDPLTGIFGISNVLVIPREHSLWIGSKNPVGSNPFSFYNAVPKIGCNAPWSAAAFENGLVWFDQRTGTVWSYTVGGGIESIGRPIDKTIVKGITDPQKIFGSYNPIENEYIVCIPTVGSSLVKAWTWNFRTQAWAYDEIDNVCSADDVDITSGFVAINDLIGTINQLVGNIDDLSPTAPTVPTRAYGKTDGNIIYEDINSYTDSGINYVTELISKQFEIPEDDIIVATIRLEYQIESECFLELYIQKNGGAFKKVKGPSLLNQLNKTKVFKYDQQIRCRQLCFKLLITGGKFHFTKYEIQVYVSGKSNR